jgi:hypothetical protein
VKITLLRMSLYAACKLSSLELSFFFYWLLSCFSDRMAARSPQRDISLGFLWTTGGDGEAEVQSGRRALDYPSEEVSSETAQGLLSLVSPSIPPLTVLSSVTILALAAGGLVALGGESLTVETSARPDCRSTVGMPASTTGLPTSTSRMPDSTARAPALTAVASASTSRVPVPTVRVSSALASMALSAVQTSVVVVTSTVAGVPSSQVQL